MEPLQENFEIYIILNLIILILTRNQHNYNNYIEYKKLHEEIWRGWKLRWDSQKYKEIPMYMALVKQLCN